MNNLKRFTIVTLLGIRPDIIRMHKLIRLLDNGQKTHKYRHIFAHTGQHFDFELDEVFYKELGVRTPDINFHIGETLKSLGGPTSHAYQISLLFTKTAEFIEKNKPDAIMYLGDTNSVVSSIIASRYSVPVIHIEGGGRSFDWRMPEEKNRIVIDHLSDMIYCYLPRYKEILLSEGISEYRIKVVGNIIDDAIKSFLPIAQKNNIFESLKIKSNGYILATLHREENIQSKEIFAAKIKDLVRLSQETTVVFPIMPRAASRIKQYKLEQMLVTPSIIRTKPLGFLEFLKLEKHAKLIITDSGTVQEEALILGVPCLVTRLSTERPETIEAKATILSDDNLYDNAQNAMKLGRNWNKKILNPYSTSPSEVIYKDIITKIKSGFFVNSRKFSYIKTSEFVKEAYWKK